MNKKLEKFKEGFVKQQFELIDEIIKKQDQLDLTDHNNSKIYVLLESSILSNVFRLKGIFNTIKELIDEEIEIPVKYEKYFKTAKELVYMKGDDLIILVTDGEKEREMSVNDLFLMIKTSKNGQQDKKDNK